MNDYFILKIIATIIIFCLVHIYFFDFFYSCGLINLKVRGVPHGWFPREKKIRGQNRLRFSE